LQAQNFFLEFFFEILLGNFFWNFFHENAERSGATSELHKCSLFSYLKTYFKQTIKMIAKKSKEVYNFSNLFQSDIHLCITQLLGIVPDYLLRFPNNDSSLLQSSSIDTQSSSDYGSYTSTTSDQLTSINQLTSTTSTATSTTEMNQADSYPIILVS
jgi:hypothetical protein